MEQQDQDKKEELPDVGKLPAKVIPQADIDAYNERFPEPIPLRRDPDSSRPRNPNSTWIDFTRWF